MLQKLTLSQYVSILTGMKRDVREAFLLLFRPPAGTFPEFTDYKPHDTNFTVLEIESMTTIVSIDLAIPFTLDPERDQEPHRIVDSNNTIIAVTVKRRRSTLDPWQRDTKVGEQGVWIQKAISFDQDGVDAVSKLLVEFVSTLFEPETAIA